MSKLKVNDEEQEVTLPLTITDLIKLNQVLQPDMVSVQLNGDFVERSDFDSTQLKENDEVDFLYFMGGGC
ncbi:MAG: sulfur carrier protein ThiS [Dysgonamonadaceae bacterium]